ncbi:myotubularin, putative [Entamoeba invadens IP1]|uniref:Myotubularin, putative n=1 Tax=Entamoeba invadens IP1 TaxID=370355 RepID=A0A0A1U5H6_ENTIV|nr:myotubularin, putative [Entamoeba invadens IP1]ELP89583.1 myotubularin, putative [Entamoeba invadens IP1]|eukprot:XP_004256354.1 myotubularin, putative [Entamoeba invadens IP1]
MFLKLMVRIEICTKEVYLSIPSGLKNASNAPKVPQRKFAKQVLPDFNDRGYWEVRLKDLAHEALQKLQGFYFDQSALGNYFSFDYTDYSTNFYALKSVFLGVDINLLTKPLFDDYAQSPEETFSNDCSSSEQSITPPLSGQRCKTLPPNAFVGISQNLMRPTSPRNTPRFTTNQSVVIPKDNPKEQIIVSVKNVRILFRNDVWVERQNEEHDGRIVVTSAKFCFIDSNDGQFNIFVPLTKIADLKKVNTKKTEHVRVLEFSTKENVFVKFSFLKNRQGRKSVCTAINATTFSPPITMNVFKLLDLEVKRITYYDVLDEFIRLGLNKTDQWRVTLINDDYKFCPTYPRELIVPKEISDEVLLKSGEYRSRHRIPVLTWVHENGACVVRCSQPMPGIVGKKSEEDISVLEMIGRCGQVTTSKLHILDSRPKANAVANIAMGGGYEADEDYPFSVMEFENIDNIHVVREGWQKLCVMCMGLHPQDHTTTVTTSIEVQNWWKVLTTIFASSIKMCRYLESGESVLVHCTDGWDRTSQCCSLCEMMLDPYFRTLDGFVVLVEKDWKSFGHRFMTRSGVGAHCPHGQYSPVFHQFIECVFILLTNYPTMFQFNEEFLLEIDDAVFCANYGTFLFDCSMERDLNRVDERTLSLWSNVYENRERFSNPQYIKSSDKMHTYGLPKFVLWEKYYFANRKY